MAFGPLIGVIIRTIPPLPQSSIMDVGCHSVRCCHGSSGSDYQAHFQGLDFAHEASAVRKVRTYELLRNSVRSKQEAAWQSII
jgi:hypothetical protein